MFGNNRDYSGFGNGRGYDKKSKDKIRKVKNKKISEN